MSKIIEKILEPARIEAGSTFKIKVKVIRYATYQEMKAKTVNFIKNYTVADLKGEGRWQEQIIIYLF